MNLKALTSIILGLSLPLQALAAMQITEIMYDVSGTDAGREWVEITNTGSNSADVSGFKFFEANTNHALIVVSGSGVLQPGISAIIADDAVKFLLEYPAYGGALFDSSFSLSNTGETIVLKDDGLEVLDTVDYNSGTGAAGDGNSLQRSGQVFLAAAPNPGSYSGSPIQDSGNTAESTTASTSSTQNTQTQAGVGPPPITVRIKADMSTMVGGGSFFIGEAFGTQGAPLPNVRFIWNFGDGATAEGVRVFHAYSYPGKYMVQLTAAYNYSSGMDKMVVEAVSANVALRSEGDGSLLVLNLSDKDIDIGLWSLVEGSSTYTIPEDTLMLAKGGIRFAPTITNLKGGVGATLRYPNNALATSATAGPNSPLRGERVTARSLETYQKTPTTPPVVDSTPAPISAIDTNEGEILGVANEKQKNGSSLFSWPLAALVLIVGAGVAAVYYLQRQSPLKGETSSTAEEFDIE